MRVSSLYTFSLTFLYLSKCRLVCSLSRVVIFDKKKININVITTSEIKISVLISNKDIKKAVACLHKEFKLD